MNNINPCSRASARLLPVHPGLIRRTACTCLCLLGFLCATITPSQAQSIDGNIPFPGEQVVSSGADITLRPWTMGLIRTHRLETINSTVLAGINGSGGLNYVRKDIASVVDRLGYDSLKVETNNFVGHLDLRAGGSVIVSMLVDDYAQLTVTEIARNAGVTGEVFAKSYNAGKEQALWHPDAYKEFLDEPIPPGRKYSLNMFYRNKVNGTGHPVYGGRIDVDGMSVYTSPFDQALVLQQRGGVDLAGIDQLPGDANESPRPMYVRAGTDGKAHMDFQMLLPRGAYDWELTGPVSASGTGWDGTTHPLNDLPIGSYTLTSTFSTGGGATDQRKIEMRIFEREALVLQHLGGVEPAGVDQLPGDANEIPHPMNVCAGADGKAHMDFQMMLPRGLYNWVLTGPAPASGAGWSGMALPLNNLPPGSYALTSTPTSGDLADQRKIEFNILKVELGYANAINSPKVFEYGKTTVASPCLKDPEKLNVDALAVYYKDVAIYVPNTVAYLNAFSVDLKLLPTGCSSVQWSKVSGPNSGTLLDAGQATAKLQNPQEGGVYVFDVAAAGKSTRTQLWFPVAGPDISAYWQGEINYLKNTWGPAYRAKLNSASSAFVLQPAIQALMMHAIAVQDISNFGMNLDWTGSVSGTNTPCGGPNYLGDEFRQTMHGVVIDFRKRNNMLYALIGREMGLFEVELKYGPDLMQAGSPDSPAAIESYEAGFDLFDGQSLLSVMHSRGYAMQEPGSWAAKEWPSQEISQQGLTRKAANQLQGLIQ